MFMPGLHAKWIAMVGAGKVGRESGSGFSLEPLSGVASREVEDAREVAAGRVYEGDARLRRWWYTVVVGEG